MNYKNRVVPIILCGALLAWTWTAGAGPAAAPVAAAPRSGGVPAADAAAPAADPAPPADAPAGDFKTLDQEVQG